MGSNYFNDSYVDIGDATYMGYVDINAAYEGIKDYWFDDFEYETNIER